MAPAAASRQPPAPLPERSPCRAALLAALALLPWGCWSRLTTPKESFLYDIGGTAPVMPAPAYQEELAKIEARLGPERFRLAVGTRLVVEIYGHGIRETVNIRPDGMIDLPLVGEVQAEDKTIPEFKQEVASRYEPFFREKPQILVNTERDNELAGVGVRAGDVSVINPRASGFFGSGAGAGVVNITGDERLSQIMATTNALTTDAEWRQIAVIRRSRDQQESVIILCDMERMIKYGDLRQDLQMRNGDIVFIPIERHTVIQEIWATFQMVAQLTGNANTITDYIERIERY